MVHKYPPTVAKMRASRDKVPESEIEFYKLLDALNDDWYVWHSVNWEKDDKPSSGEADFLLFNENYGYIVLEVKGGIIRREDGVFYTTNTESHKEFELNKSPFEQARSSMYHVRDFFCDQAKETEEPHLYLKNNGFFPLNYEFGVVFPNTDFKSDIEYLSFSKKRIFDKIDWDRQEEWKEGDKKEPSPLDLFIIRLLDRYVHLRVIKREVKDFFLQLMGSNISHFMNLKRFYEERSKELEQINQVQDYLLDCLIEKKNCIFRGSAGSGKTFIAMKQAIRNYHKKRHTLFLCFNRELRKSIQKYLSEKIEKPYEAIKETIYVDSLHAFLFKLLMEMFLDDTRNELSKSLRKFVYKPISERILQNTFNIPQKFKFDMVLVDEAQDIDESLWKVFPCFLKSSEDSYLYIFYDHAQSIFVESFSVEGFGMDKKSDLIVLDRNLRNTEEIAKWIMNKTEFGNYKQFSGISGFKITSGKFETFSLALVKAMTYLNARYLDRGIISDDIAILSYYKLSKLFSGAPSREGCSFVRLKNKAGDRKNDVYLIEPDSIDAMPSLKRQEFKSERTLLFKTITSFKGLEADIIVLLIPNISQFKEIHPDRYQNFLKQIYVGASRAKFKLYFFQYKIK